MRSVSLLGIRVDVLDMEGTLQWIDAHLSAQEGVFVNTLNLNLLLNVDRYPGLRELFNENDLNVADGVPLQWLARLKGRSLPGRVSGVDLMYRICETSGSKGYRVFLLGARAEVALKAAEVLKRDFHGLTLAGTYSPPFQATWDERENSKILQCITNADANIVLVAFGFPKQEYWIQQHKGRIPGCVFINVGGSLEFAAGLFTRAPHWMQRNGLEWLWRVSQEPGRLMKRYLWDGIRLVPCLLKWKWKDCSINSVQAKVQRD